MLYGLGIPGFTENKVALQLRGYLDTALQRWWSVKMDHWQVNDAGVSVAGLCAKVSAMHTASNTLKP
ncbi:hypothetical protein [Paraflavitalea soli]|uniref:hypothetical protein n=1 Tax=Paraflavitalea soli TaxID=2315862 RepID=UPI0013C41CD4|nr:hypothetical protein [Paraflavitalea soli]